MNDPLRIGSLTTDPSSRQSTYHRNHPKELPTSSLGRFQFLRELEEVKEMVVVPKGLRLRLKVVNLSLQPRPVSVDL